MEAKQFINLSENEQIAALRQPIEVNTPLYLERLKTALENNNPLCLLILPQSLKDIFHKIKSVYHKSK